MRFSSRSRLGEGVNATHAEEKAAFKFHPRHRPVAMVSRLPLVMESQPVDSAKTVPRVQSPGVKANPGKIGMASGGAVHRNITAANCSR